MSVVPFDRSQRKCEQRHYITLLQRYKNHSVSLSLIDRVPVVDDTRCINLHLRDSRECCDNCNTGGNCNVHNGDDGGNCWSHRSQKWELLWVRPLCTWPQNLFSLNMCLSTTLHHRYLPSVRIKRRFWKMTRSLVALLQISIRANRDLEIFQKSRLILKDGNYWWWSTVLEQQMVPM